MNFMVTHGLFPGRNIDHCLNPKLLKGRPHGVYRGFCVGLNIPVSAWDPKIGILGKWFRWEVIEGLSSECYKFKRYIYNLFSEIIARSANREQIYSRNH